MKRGMKVWGDSLVEKVSALLLKDRERMDMEWRLKNKKVFSRDDWQIFNATLRKTVEENR